jgi:hypothetical protein
MQSIAVYCGSSSSNSAEFIATAKDLGHLLADRAITLVYGGGRVGLMGAIADATMERGGRVTGVIPTFLKDQELGHEGVTELIEVNSMHARKQKMIELAEGFIAMPGGFGTLEEIAEALTWSQLGLHGFPCGLLNIKGYYDGLIACADAMHQSELLRTDDRNRLLSDSDAPGLLQKMLAWQAPAQLKWEHLRAKKL